MIKGDFLFQVLDPAGNLRCPPTDTALPDFQHSLSFEAGVVENNSLIRQADCLWHVRQATCTSTPDVVIRDILPTLRDT